VAGAAPYGIGADDWTEDWASKNAGQPNKTTVWQDVANPQSNQGFQLRVVLNWFEELKQRVPLKQRSSPDNIRAPHSSINHR
jgi:hypothetical protein